MLRSERAVFEIESYIMMILLKYLIHCPSSTCLTNLENATGCWT